MNRMYKFLIFFFTIIVTSTNAKAQATCGDAVARLQHYIGGVNTFAHTEYHQGIPLRCGGNPVCMQAGLQQLNAWYFSQSTMVNNWYSQIVANCSTSTASPDRLTVPSRQVRRDAPPELDEDEISSIDVDDEDKTVRIRIPSNPMGYQR